MQQEILNTIGYFPKVISVELEEEQDINADNNACYMVHFRNNKNVLNDIKELKDLIEYKYNTFVYLLKEQIEDQINEGEEYINIDFYVDTW